MDQAAQILNSRITEIEKNCEILKQLIECVKVKVRNPTFKKHVL